MRRKIPSTASLVAFEAAARHQSFTQAAQELSLTQGAVCRQVAALEQFLGIELFRRTRRGVLLTESGLDYSRKVALQLDAVERDALAAMSSQPAHAIELAVMHSFASQWLLPRLKDFQRLHPDVTVHLTHRTRPFLFAEPQIDAMIYLGDSRWPGVQAHYLMSECLIPVCSPELMGRRAELTATQVAQLPLLHNNSRREAWASWFRMQGVAFEGSQQGPHYDMSSLLAQAAVLGMGVALLPRFLIRQELADGRLRIAHRAALETPNEAYYLMIPQRKHDSPPLMAFRDWLLLSAQHYLRTLERAEQSPASEVYV